MGEIRRKILNNLVPELDVMILIFRNENGQITYASPNAGIWLSNSFPDQKIEYLYQIFGPSFEEKRLAGDLINHHELVYPYTIGKSFRFASIKIATTENPQESYLIIKKESESITQLGFDDFINFFPEAYFETDEKGRITYLNKVGCEKMELCNIYKKQSVHIFDIIAPEERERIEANFRRNLDGERYLGSEYKFLTYSKKELFVEVFSKEKYDINGNAIGIRGIAIDITNRKLEQQKYQKQNLQISILNKLSNSLSIADFFKIAGSELKQIFELNLIELFILEKEDEFKSLKCIYNNFFEKKGKSITNLLGQKYFDVEYKLKGEFWKSFYEQENLVQIHGKQEVRQVLNELLDNSNFRFKSIQKKFADFVPLNYLLIAPLVINQKTIGHCTIERNTPFQEEELKTIQLFVHIIALFFHRKDIEYKLLESELKYRTIFDNTPLGIYRSTPDGILLEANESFAHTFGYESANEMIKSTKDIRNQYYLHSEVRDEILDKLKTNDSVIRRETVFKRKDNATFDGIIHMKAIKDYNGKIQYFDGLLEDITERKLVEERIILNEQLVKTQNRKLKKVNKKFRKINEQLLIAKQKAEESDHLKSAFLANMSHEIRTPLNGIMGFSSLLADDGIDQAKRQQYAQIVSDSSTQLLNIVNDILDISKIETNQISIFKSEMDVNILLNELYDFFKPAVKLKNLSLNLEFDQSQSSLTIDSDAIRLKQIITNFISNSLKFTEEGGITIGFKLTNDTIVFFVRDTGIGIHDSEKQFIFDRFRQAGDIYHKANNGTGLGLAISKGLADLLGGEIQMESELGKGSIFSLILPLKN